jgi:hypothetical protein
MMPFYWLALGILITWRVTHLISIETGPWRLFEKLRRLAGSGALGELFACFYCLSLWIAAPLAVLLGSGWRHRLLLWPALSAGAILLERATLRSDPAAPILFNDTEDPNVLRS